MITVANPTQTAARVKYAFDHRAILIHELRSPERTLHIESKVLERAERRSSRSMSVPLAIPTTSLTR